jgi:hypothetical protein
MRLSNTASMVGCPEGLVLLFMPVDLKYCLISEDIFGFLLDSSKRQFVAVESLSSLSSDGYLNHRQLCLPLSGARPQINVSLELNLLNNSCANSNTFLWNPCIMGTYPSMMDRLELLPTAKALPPLLISDIALLAILVIPNGLQGRESHCRITW